MQETYEGIVLDRSFRGESGLLLSVFCKDAGLLVIHKKVSQKKIAGLPDFFDSATFDVEKAKTGGIYFLTNFEISVRRLNIAQDYDAFFNACQISKFVQKNSKYLENFGALFSYLEISLNAIAGGADSWGVFVKFLYAFAKSEGYAVKEDFATSLEESEYLTLKKILATPAIEMPHFENVQILLASLTAWISSCTDFDFSN